MRPKWISNDEPELFGALLMVGAVATPSILLTQLAGISSKGCQY